MLLQELQVPSPLENEQKLFNEQLLESVHAFESVVCATVVDDVVVVAMFVVIVDTVVAKKLDKVGDKILSMFVINLTPKIDGHGHDFGHECEADSDTDKYGQIWTNSGHACPPIFA